MEKTVGKIEDIELYGKLFTYNPFKKIWYSGSSEEITKLNNGVENTCISGTSIAAVILKTKAKSK